MPDDDPEEFFEAIRQAPEAGLPDQACSFTRCTRQALFVVAWDAPCGCLDGKTPDRACLIHRDILLSSGSRAGCRECGQAITIISVLPGR